MEKEEEEEEEVEVVRRRGGGGNTACQPASLALGTGEAGHRRERERETCQCECVCVCVCVSTSECAKTYICLLLKVCNNAQGRHPSIVGGGGDVRHTYSTLINCVKDIKRTQGSETVGVVLHSVQIVSDGVSLIVSLQSFRFFCRRESLSFPPRRVGKGSKFLFYWHPCVCLFLTCEIILQLCQPFKSGSEKQKVVFQVYCEPIFL